MEAALNAGYGSGYNYASSGNMANAPITQQRSDIGRKYLQEVDEYQQKLHSQNNPVPKVNIDDMYSEVPRVGTNLEVMAGGNSALRKATLLEEDSDAGSMQSSDIQAHIQRHASVVKSPYSHMISDANYTGSKDSQAWRRGSYDEGVDADYRKDVFSQWARDQKPDAHNEYLDKCCQRVCPCVSRKSRGSHKAMVTTQNVDVDGVTVTRVQTEDDEGGCKLSLKDLCWILGYTALLTFVVLLVTGNLSR